MSRMKLRLMKSFPFWDGTVRCPREVVVGYDELWDRFFAHVFLGGKNDRPNISIGLHGADGAPTVEELANALRPYAHLPRWATRQLLADRKSANKEARVKAAEIRESEDPGASIQTWILHPVEQYLLLSDLLIEHRVELTPVGPVAAGRPIRCDACGGKVVPGQSLFLYVPRDRFICSCCAFPGLEENRAPRARMDYNADLLASAAKGSLLGVWQALADGAIVNACDEAGRSALFLACTTSHATMTRGLLAAGIRVDSEKATFAPLVAAIHRRKKTLVTMLLRLGAPVDADDRTLTPLLCAAESGQPELVRRLLRKGADPNRVSCFGKSALGAATERVWLGKTHEVVVELLAAGARVDVADDQGDTPLHWAVARRDLRLVELLLRSGADPARGNTIGETPLTIATRMGRDAIAVTLRAYTITSVM